MKLRPSEVFDNYAAIALDRGIVCTAADSEDKKSEKYDPRRGSDDLDTIELLYGVKPNGDEKDIVDQAHPEAVIISPSYDRLNGLVENVKERHNVMVGICQKPQQAKLTKHRYATAELMNELIRLGFLMDNQDEVKLAKMADECAGQLQKKAFFWIPLIAGGIALIGAYNNLAYVSQGVQNDCDNAIDAVEKFAAENPDVANEMKDLIAGIKYCKELNQKALAATAKFKSGEKGNVVQNAVEIGNSSQGQDAKSLLDKYKSTAIRLAAQIIKVYVPLIKSAEEPEDRTSSSIIEGLSDAWHALVGTKKNDVLKVLVGANLGVVGEGGLVGSLRKSVEHLAAKEKAINSYVEQNHESLVKYLEEDPNESAQPKQKNSV